ncbi:hypothetical protein D9M68_410830 [compost metagenome]
MLCKRLSLALLLVAAAQVALASPSTGTIQFKGVLKGTTCDLMVNGQRNTPNQTIALERVPSIQLARTGNTARATHLNIGVVDCRGFATKMRASLKGANGTTVTNGRLDNMATVNAAKNIQLQVSANDGQGGRAGIVDVGGDQSMLPHADFDGSWWTGVGFYVDYYANGPVTEGKVQAALEYTVEYQ